MPKTVAKSLPHAENPDAVYGTKKIIITNAAIAFRIFFLSWYLFEKKSGIVIELHQRTKEGMETARLNGKQIGTPKGAKLTTKKSIAAKDIIKKHSIDFNGTLKDDDVIKLAGISRKTYYKYKKELREEQ